MSSLVTILVGQNKNVVEPKHGGIITRILQKIGKANMNRIILPPYTQQNNFFPSKQFKSTSTVDKTLITWKMIVFDINFVHSE